jgi:hypothetical protein
MNFTVIIPTHDRRSVLRTAIDSVLAQDAGDCEVVVVDDGSSDGTTEWLTETYSDKPLRVLRNTGARGPAGGRNCGIRAARGEFVAFLDSDDSYLPWHLTDALSALERYPEVDVVFGRARYERDGQPVDYMGPGFERKLGLAPKVLSDDAVTLFSSSFLEHLLRYGCWFNLSSVVLRAAAARELMNEQLRIGEDYEFWVRLASTRRFACLHRPQIRYLLHDGNISVEAASTAADDAPHLLRTLQVMRGHPGLTGQHVRLIEDQIVGVLFDWAYRCRQRRQWLEAARLHWRSLLLGRRRANAIALLKLLVLPLMPRHPRRDLRGR